MINNLLFFFFWSITSINNIIRAEIYIYVLNNSKYLYIHVMKIAKIYDKDFKIYNTNF